MKFLFITTLITITFGITNSCVAQNPFISKAISAADHKRPHPLQDALNAGFAGVVAEVNLSKEGQLKCGSKYLEDLYIKPLQGLVNQNNGRVYAGVPNEFLLILSIKSDSTETYNTLTKLLASYSTMLTEFKAENVTKKAVRVIISGEITLKLIQSQSVRLCTADEPIQKIAQGYGNTIISLSTLNFGKQFNWSGEGNMTNTEFYSMTTFVKLAHKSGRLVRFQRIPEKANAFNLMDKAGVDLFEINDIDNFISYWRNRY